MNQGKLKVVKKEMARHFRNQWAKMDQNGLNLIQVTITSTTVGKIP